MDVMEKIKSYNKNLSEDLLKIKYAAMSESPFRFYRGACHLFADDFEKLHGYDSKIKTWVCGDLHFENFGSFKAQNRLVYFDMNDFDEAILTTPEAELTRFLSSIIIAAKNMKVGETKLKSAIENLLHYYIFTLQQGKALLMEKETAHGKLRKYFEQLESRNREDFIASRTENKNGKVVLKIDDKKLLPLKDELKFELFLSLKTFFKHEKMFRDLEFIDAAFRIAGTGSLGLQRYAILCFNKKKNKHYLIECKQSRASCYTKLVQTNQPKFKNEAERIIFVQNIMQFYSPDFLHSFSFQKKNFVVKELQPTADKLALVDFKTNFNSLQEVALEMAELMAYAQLRSCCRSGSSSADELISLANKNKWQKKIPAICFEIATRNEKYFHEFLKIKK